MEDTIESKQKWNTGNSELYSCIYLLPVKDKKGTCLEDSNLRNSGNSISMNGYAAHYRRPDQGQQIDHLFPLGRPGLR